MCNCKKTKVEAPPSIPVEELKFPDTPDGLLAKELKEWKEEQHRIIMEDINKSHPE
jgi:hypothetical protein